MRTQSLSPFEARREFVQAVEQFHAMFTMDVFERLLRNGDETKRLYYAMGDVRSHLQLLLPQQVPTITLLTHRPLEDYPCPTTLQEIVQSLIDRAAQILTPEQMAADVIRRFIINFAQDAHAAMILYEVIHNPQIFPGEG